MCRTVTDGWNVILSPHFDDAVLSLGGLIAKAPDRAVVVTVFAGVPLAGVIGRWDRLSGFPTADAAARARRQENEAALALIGVPQNGIRNLDYLDDQYRSQCTRGQAPTSDLCSSIAEDIRHLVSACHGRVNLFAPASTWHPDHQIVTDAVVELYRKGEFPGASFLLYQDQPYAYLELRRKSLAPLKFARFSLLADLPEKTRDLTAEREFIDLDQSEVYAKINSFKKYRSQFPFLKGLISKMLLDFCYYQARAAQRAARYVEVVYRLEAPEDASIVRTNIDGKAA